MADTEMLQVPTVKFGADRCYTEVPKTNKKGKPSTWKDMLEQVPNSSNFNVRIQGDDIQDHLEEPIKEDVTVFIAPKRISQG